MAKRKAASTADIKQSQAYEDALDFVNRKLERNPSETMFPTLESAIKTHPSPATFLIDELIPKDSVGLMYGGDASYLAIVLAYSIGLGMAWNTFDRRISKGNVIVMSADTSYTMQAFAAEFATGFNQADRQKIMRGFKNIRIFDIRKHLGRFILDPKNDAFQSALRFIMLEKINPSFILIDGIESFADEAGSTRAARISCIEALRIISKTFNAAVIFTKERLAPIEEDDLALSDYALLSDYAYHVSRKDGCVTAVIRGTTFLEQSGKIVLRHPAQGEAEA